MSEKLQSIDDTNPVYAQALKRGRQQAAREVKSLVAAKQFCTMQGCRQLRVHQPDTGERYYTRHDGDGRYWSGPFTAQEFGKREL